MKLSTYGIIFLGTPHQGGEGVALGTRVLDVKSVFLHTNKNLRFQPEKEPERIQEQLVDYRGIQAEFATIFAYETLPTPRGPLPAAVVVPKLSAVVPGASKTETIAIHANHVEMVKFPSPGNQGFKRVSGHLKLMVNRAPDEIQKKWIARETMDMALVAKPKQYFRVPFDLRDVPRSNIFVGRQPEIELMKQNLLRNTDDSERKVCVVYGLGGIGKTQLAIEYARLHKRSYTSVFWLDGRSEMSLVQSLLSIANRLPKSQILNFDSQEIRGIEESKERAQDVLQWFALEGNCGWLLIFDSIDRTSFGASGSGGESLTSYNITKYFPRGDVGTIIITTRLQRLADLGDSINLRKIDIRNSILILERHAGKSLKQSINFIASKEGAEVEEFDPDAVALVKRLEGLPLALVFAGSYIRSTTIAKYLEFYTNSWNDLHETMNIRHDYPRRTIITTWATSYQELKRKDQGAAKLLQFWGYLDNQDLWFQLLQWPSYQAQAPDWLRQITATEVRFMETIRTLLDYSLIEQKEGSHSYSMHAVVHDWIREFVNREGDDDLFRLGVTCVGLAVPTQDERSYWTAQRRLLPHASRLSEYSHKNKLFSIPQEVIDNSSYLHGLEALGNLYSDRGRLAEAEAMYERALAGSEKALGPEHTSTLSTVNNLGILYKYQGRLAEAEAMYERALAGYEKALGPEHTSTLDTINNLGILYSDQGRLAEAEAMYERALAGGEKVLGPEHTSTLDTVNNLGILYKYRGRLAEAEAMYERALAGYEKALGSEHTSTLDTVNNLGNLYSDQGRLVEAEAMYERALAGYEKALGPEHTSILVTASNLGILYFDQGRLTEAEAMYERALSGKEKVLGPEHMSTLDTVSNLSILYSDQGRLAEAEAMYKRALAGYEKTLGPEHTSTLDTVNNLGILYNVQGRLAEAEAMYERALAGCGKALGPEHMSTLSTVNNLGNLYSDQGRLAEAEAMYERALSGKKKVLGPEHMSTLSTANNLGNLYSGQGRLAEAEAMYERALSGKKKVLGPEHTSTLDTVSNSSIFYSDQKRLAEAEAVYERALSGKEKAPGPEHKSAHVDAGQSRQPEQLLFETGRLAGAEAMYERGGTHTPQR